MTSEIILIGGSEGSGRSRLAKSLVNELNVQMPIEHLAVGDIIRSIGRGALRSYRSIEISRHLQGPNALLPIDNEIMYDVISESLAQHSSADVILLDGYPRLPSQMDDLAELALFDDRTIAGMVVTQTSEAVSLMRMIKRGTRDFTPHLTVTTARERLQLSIENSTAVIQECLAHAIPVAFIDTSHSKIETTEVGLNIVQRFLHPHIDEDEEIS
jgi:adenylate kinase family enzyme